MRKTLQLALNQYNPIPSSLQGATPNSAKGFIDVDLASLYHHYYLDSYNIAPPSLDPAHFEQLRFLMPSDVFFRFQGNGVGASTNAKRSRSSDMGQAFCRWFMHEHIGVKYFAHLEHLIGVSHPSFPGFSVRRTGSGDIPDYLCSYGLGSVELAEAKGRYTSVGFHTTQFAKWRQQFTRVSVLNAAGVPVSVKGHIVATRFATQIQPRVTSTLYAEDPSTDGLEPISLETALPLSRQVAASHYVDALIKLGQQSLAVALWTANSEREAEFLAPIWAFASEGRERYFVGGYYLRQLAWPPAKFRRGSAYLRQLDLHRLVGSNGIFVGLELSVFKYLVAVARGEHRMLDAMAEVEPIKDPYSGLSMLRDGSVMGPLQMFRPLDVEVF